MAAQDIPHRHLIDGMTEVHQGTLDAAIAPRRILFSHAYDEWLDFLRDTGTSKLTTVLTAIKLPGEQSLVPAQEGVWRGDGRHRFEAFATKGMGQRGKAAAFRISESQPVAAELGCEDAILLDQIRDYLLLVTLHPAGNRGDEHLQDHGVSSVGNRDKMFGPVYA